MAKTNTKTNTTPATTLDWNKEASKGEAIAKQHAGSRGDALAKTIKAASADTPAGALIRSACGDAGVQALAEQPRNVLHKIARLATCIVGREPWCDASALLPENRRKADASVAIALAGLGAGNERQKEVIAHAATRYPGGANAQMPAALEACAFFGIVERKPGGPRNSAYVIRDSKRADALLPGVPSK